MWKRNKTSGRLQVRLPFGGGTAKAIGAKAYVYPHERRFVAILGALLIILSGMYIYFVMFSIAHIATKEELSRHIRITSAAVAKLESEYLARSENITESYARAQGFVTASSQFFVEREQTFTLHNNAR